MTAYNNPNSDSDILKQANQSLTRGSAGARGRITASVKNGDVALAGANRYEHERRPIVGSVSSTNGVRRVIDQLQVVAKKIGMGIEGTFTAV